MGHKNQLGSRCAQKKRGPRTTPSSTPKFRCQEDEEDLAKEPTEEKVISQGTIV